MSTKVGTLPYLIILYALLLKFEMSNVLTRMRFYKFSDLTTSCKMQYQMKNGLLLYKEMKNLVLAFKFFKHGSSDERNEYCIQRHMNMLSVDSKMCSHEYTH